MHTAGSGGAPLGIRDGEPLGAAGGAARHPRAPATPPSFRWCRCVPLSLKRTSLGPQVRRSERIKSDTTGAAHPRTLPYPPPYPSGDLLPSAARIQSCPPSCSHRTTRSSRSSCLALSPPARLIRISSPHISRPLRVRSGFGCCIPARAPQGRGPAPYRRYAAESAAAALTLVAGGGSSQQGPRSRGTSRTATRSASQSPCPAAAAASRLAGSDSVPRRASGVRLVPRYHRRAAGVVVCIFASACGARVHSARRLRAADPPAGLGGGCGRRLCDGFWRRSAMARGRLWRFKADKLEASQDGFCAPCLVELTQPRERLTCNSANMTIAIRAQEVKNMGEGLQLRGLLQCLTQELRKGGQRTLSQWPPAFEYLYPVLRCVQWH